jgi:chromate transporter
MNLWNLFKIFLRFGLLAWGGPVAQINMIREELVEKRKWIANDKFKRVLAIYQALPGPEAHELCVYFGMVKAGRIGATIAGLGFMLPGFCLMILLSWLYVSFGSGMLIWFAGVVPAVAALIVRATHRIAGHVLHGTSLICVAAISVILTLLKVHFSLVFLICVLWQILWTKNYRKVAISLAAISIAFFALSFFGQQSLVLQANDGHAPSGLFIEGLKAGLFSFGGAYTVIPFLKESMIGTYSGITDQSFYDGIALSSVIPAPLVIFGTFLGFIANGFWGAFLMTAGIFLPAFSFTLFGHKHLEKLLENSALHLALDAVAAAVVGMLAVTALDIFITSVLLVSLKNILIFSAALAALFLIKKKWAIPAIVILSGIIGLMI